MNATGILTFCGVLRWSHIPLSLGFFGLQIVLSRWWLARFRFGPAEWLWRSLTYGQVQPMRSVGRAVQAPARP